MTLVLLSLPWAAAGVFVCASRTGELLRLERRTARVLLTGLLGLGVATGASLQLKPLHESRRGHHDAGLWLASNAGHGEAVLDTRGWAAFVSGRPAYDYWHVRQALSDGHLTYVVVGEDELDARSRRASTLRAVLAHAATPVAEFPKLPTGRDDLVRVYRFHRPESWEGLRP